MPESKTTKKHFVSSRHFAMMMDIRLERWKCRVRIVMLCFLRRMFYTYSWAVTVDCGKVVNVNECRTELEQHYLTRYCPGSAVAVYVMTRDRYATLSVSVFNVVQGLRCTDGGRLITKGYRMEKRLIAFDCRPLRFFCGKCEKPFSMDETERVHRQTSTNHPRRVLVDCSNSPGTPSYVECKHCGDKCNISSVPHLPT